MIAIDTIMTMAPVIPVLVIEDIDHAQPIAEALVAGGLRALEVTLRTPAALKVISEMSKADGAIIGAGTVLNRHDLDASLEAGAQFIVSPGLTQSLAKPPSHLEFRFCPGFRLRATLCMGSNSGSAASNSFRPRPAEASLRSRLWPDPFIAAASVRRGALPRRLCASGSRSIASNASAEAG